LWGLRHFVEQRPALYRFAFRITEGSPLVKRWLLRGLTQTHAVVAPVAQPETVAPVANRRATLEIPPMIAAEVDHVSYLLRRAIEAKRRD
jgi:hypothetical protein